MTPPLHDTLMRSFHFVKNDIIALENRQNALLTRIKHLEDAHHRLILAFNHTTALSHASFRLIGDNITKEIHTEDCILARSADALNRRVFHSKLDAKNKGFNECICMY